MTDGATLPERHPDAPAPGELVKSHYHRCFGCGDDNTDGLHLRITAGEGLTVSAEFTVGDQHQGTPGLAHGGILTAACDETLAALSFLIRKSLVTAHLETDFKKPVPVGSVLYIVATLDDAQRRRITTSAVGRLNAPDGPVAIQAKALFIEVPLEHFTQHGRPEDVELARSRVEVRAATHDLEVNP